VVPILFGEIETTNRHKLSASKEHEVEVARGGSELSLSTQRLRCCICGRETEDANDYVQLTLSTDTSESIQYFGAHAAHLSEVFALGFNIEILD
jgi:hypothetical protein